MHPPLVEEVEEVAEEVAEEVVEEAEDKRTLQQPPASDSAETLQRYSWETEKKQTASSPNLNATT